MIGLWLAADHARWQHLLAAVRGGYLSVEVLHRAQQRREHILGPDAIVQARAVTITNVMTAVEVLTRRVLVVDQDNARLTDINLRLKSGLDAATARLVTAREEMTRLTTRVATAEEETARLRLMREHETAMGS